jgi:hypothetical protein
MKVFLLLIGFALVLISCETNENLMVLNGHVKGLKKGTILIQKLEDSSVVVLDSVVVDGDANFTFSETIESPQMYFLKLKIKDEELEDDIIPFFAEPGEISIRTSLDHFTTRAVIIGSKNEVKYSEYKKLIQRYKDRNLELIREELIAMQESNDSMIEAAKKKQQNISTSKYLATVNFAINNGDYELAPYLILNELNNVSIKYLDTVYNSLTPKIKDSKYGKDLESFIETRKKAEN